MLRNYLKLAWRNLTRQKGYTAINLTGLAVGFACCILIALFVRDELSYDTFHEGADRIMILIEAGPFGPASPYALADALKGDLPVVEETVRILWPGSGRLSLDGRAFNEEDGVYHAEASFFDVFTFSMLEGSPEAALREPNTAVVSPAFAEKYFPGQSPIGETFIADRYGEFEYRITGVAEPQPNSFLDFNALLSFSTLDYAETHAGSWGGFMFLTFARLSDGATPDVFTEQTNDMVAQHLDEDSEVRFSAVPIVGLYLSDFVNVRGFRGEWRYIYLFGTIAFIILLLACVNYTNLMTARSTMRAKEVGVRRTVGAQREQVAGQFWLESLLLSATAFVVGLGLARAALPGFNHLFEKSLAFGDATPFLLLLGGAALAVGLLAGCYPALYLSGFRPVHALRSGGSEGRSGRGIRKGLVVFQFAIAAGLLVSTLIVYQQLQYAQEKDLGFVGEQVLTLNAPEGQSVAFAQAVRNHNAVEAATVAQGIPGRFNVRIRLQAEMFSREARTDLEEGISFLPASVDHDYLQTLGLELVAGRDFSREHPSDEQEAYILNETAVSALGWTVDEAIGMPFTTDADSEGSVIGVVRDFHVRSLRNPIDPILLHLHEGQGWSQAITVAARLSSGAFVEGREHIEAQWSQFSDKAFEYTFLDEQFAALYETERRLGQVFALFAGLAILIACLGLFGLAAYAAEQRCQEIGIRKVLGATVQSIVALLSRDFLTLVLIGFVLAAPLAYYAMQRWLEDFAYRIDIGPGIFVLAGVLAVSIALLTVSYQALRAAWMNPTEAIRQE